MLLIVVAALAFAAPALAYTVSKDGTPADVTLPAQQGPASPVRADFEYNTGGSINFVPDLGGSATGWAEWFVTTVHNTTGQQLRLVELGFPCCGPATGTYGWIVWKSVGGIVPPAGPASTAEHYGQFTPVDPNPATFPPTVYTYIDVYAQNIVIPVGAYFCFGYDVTGNGGQTYYNGVMTWGWYNGAWDPDQPWGRTAILQVKANYVTSPVEETTWGAIKGLFQ
jgi:hypothetical protein